MRRKISSKQENEDDDRYKLSGWSNDEDFSYSSNILKLLEKKITYPPRDINFSKPSKQPVHQILPAVPEHIKQKSLHFSEQSHILIANHNRDTSSFPKNRCIKQGQQQEPRFKLASKDKTISMRNREIVQEQQKSTQYDRQSQTIRKKSMLKYNPFTMSQKKIGRQTLRKFEHNTKKTEESWLAKHQKTKNIESAKLKQCQPIFLDQGNSKKFIKNVRSLQKLSNRKYASPSQFNKMKQTEVMPRKTKKRMHIQTLTNMIWMQKIFGHQDRDERICKTLTSQTEDFYDGHMQQRRRLKNIQ